jgi:regulator of sirC expression with transglutaminase-like and TPR domain
MSTSPKEIDALLRLVDDPDQDVFSSVSTRIISMGKEIIPYLEHHWETHEDPVTQDRVELLIHRLQWQDLRDDFKDWIKNDSENLLAALLLISRHRYPDFDFSKTHKELEKIKRNVWLELNSFMTPLEQVNVLCNILFNYYKLKGSEVNYTKPDEFLISRLIESKQGNAISNGLLILLLAEALDINLKLIRIPRQFILACFDHSDPAQILFYLDGASGIMYSRQEVNTYFKRMNLTPTPSYFKPKNNQEVVAELVQEYRKCFTTEQQLPIQEELDELLDLLNNETDNE